MLVPSKVRYINGKKSIRFSSSNKLVGASRRVAGRKTLALFHVLLRLVPLALNSEAQYILSGPLPPEHVPDWLDIGTRHRPKQLDPPGPEFRLRSTGVVLGSPGVRVKRDQCEFITVPMPTILAKSTATY